MVNNSAFSSSSNMKKSVSRAMNYYYYYSSSITISQRPWLLFLFLFISITSISCSSIKTSTSTGTNKLSYSDHCNLIVPESTPTTQEVTTFSFPDYSTACFSGGQPFLSQNSSTNFLRELSLHTSRVYETKVNGVLKVEASLTLRNTPQTNFYCNDDHYTFDGQLQSTPAIVSPGSCFGILSFGLNGYWSEASGKVCMVGFGTTYSKQGDLLNLGAVFKLNYVKNSSVVTSLSSGTLESLSSFHDSNYFKPISILMFTKMNYEYSLVLRELENGGFSGSDDLQSLPQLSNNLCQIFASFKLTYPSTCNFEKNCSPFGGSIGYLPHVMVIHLNECSEEDQRVRVLMKFYKSGNGGGFDKTFNPNTSLIGEGLWDEKKNQLLVVACKILNATGSLENAHVGDCSIRLSLRFPATWSIRDSSTMLGQIWSSKPKNDSEYFDKIVFKSILNHVVQQGLKYEYTQIDRVRKLCTPAKKQNKTKEERYPDGDSYDMRFDISVSSSKGSFAWGAAHPLFVGDLSYELNGFPLDPTTPMPMVSKVPVNISYKISFSELSSVVFSGGNSTYDESSNEMMPVEISAEGLYEAETGGLCMVGCKKIVTKSWLPTTRDSLDCDILVKVQFPSLNSRNKGGGYIKGSIESTRKKSDLLYFEKLELTSTAYVTSEANYNIWRMDFETTLVLVSNTLTFVFVAMQLIYVQKPPETFPFASLLMLAVLTLCYIVPLLLQFEDVILRDRDDQNALLKSSRWIEVNEVLVGIETMVAFLLLCRLLQLMWSSRYGDEGSQKKNLWELEKKASLYVLLVVYVAGVFTAWLVILLKK